MVKKTTYGNIPLEFILIKSVSGKRHTLENSTQRVNFPQFLLTLVKLAGDAWISWSFPQKPQPERSFARTRRSAWRGRCS